MPSDATQLHQVSHPSAPPEHIVSSKFQASADGFWGVDAFGGLYTNGTAQYYGSPGTSQVPSSNVGRYFGECVSSMAAIYEGTGYYLTTGNGLVYPYGDAGYPGANGTSNNSAYIWDQETDRWGCS